MEGKEQEHDPQEMTPRYSDTVFWKLPQPSSRPASAQQGGSSAKESKERLCGGGTGNARRLGGEPAAPTSTELTVLIQKCRCASSAPELGSWQPFPGRNFLHSKEICTQNCGINPIQEAGSSAPCWSEVHMPVGSEGPANFLGLRTLF